MSMARALYNGVKLKSPTDYCGKPLKFLETWQVLRDHQKILAGSVSSEKASATLSVQHNSGGVLISNQDSEEATAFLQRKDQRPIGRRKAKELMLKTEVSQKKLRIAEMAVELQKSPKRRPR